MINTSPAHRRRPAIPAVNTLDMLAYTGLRRHWPGTTSRHAPTPGDHTGQLPSRRRGPVRLGRRHRETCVCSDDDAVAPSSVEVARLLGNRDSLVHAPLDRDRPGFAVVHDIQREVRQPTVRHSLSCQSQLSTSSPNDVPDKAQEPVLPSVS